MNRNDVIDVLSVVAAATRRTIGETDVDVWQAIIGDDDRELALRAVRDHLANQPGIWLEPGHIHQRVRAYRRDQLEREPDTAREARQEALAAKAAEDLELLAERKAIPTNTIHRRPAPAALTIRCPWCRASTGRPCTNTATQKPCAPHPARIEAAGVASR